MVGFILLLSMRSTFFITMPVIIGTVVASFLPGSRFTEFCRPRVKPIPPSPITDIPNVTHAYALNGMANYIVYEVTLKAMPDNTAIMTDTITGMPTD